MTVNYNLLIDIIIGISLITLLNIGGAITSRKFQYNYGLLVPLSLAIYTFTGYLTSKENSIDITLLCNGLIGMFDATAGWHLSVVLKANSGLTAEQLNQVTVKQRIVMMVIFAGVFGFIGHLMAK